MHWKMLGMLLKFYVNSINMKKDLKIRIGLSVALIICTVLFINEIISHGERNRSLYTITFEGEHIPYKTYRVNTKWNPF